jgi:hypothetical protein
MYSTLQRPFIFAGGWFGAVFILLFEYKKSDARDGLLKLSPKRRPATHTLLPVATLWLHWWPTSQVVQLLQPFLLQCRNGKTVGIL